MEVMENHDTIQEAEAGHHRGWFKQRTTADLVLGKPYNLLDTFAVALADSEDWEKVSTISLVEVSEKRLSSKFLGVVEILPEIYRL